jgi:D-alanyl-lipoteichoic acid acyltransferase DltB (MBOAT superfamily)
MLFNSIIFLIFLFIVVILNSFRWNNDWRKVFLLVCGYVFYGYWDYKFCALLAFSTILDFHLASCIAKTEDIKTRKLFLYISVFFNVGILCFFKYFNFFIDSFEMAFSEDLDFLHLKLILPVGISFYTFQSLSYIFDVYRKHCKASASLLDYATFVAFFPQLMAGPIEKAGRLLPQIANLRLPDRDDYKIGLSLISIGMFKKVLIGDTSGKFVDHIFANPYDYHSDVLIFGVLMFAIQIYMDFSGYSLIAQGCARFLGVRVMTNFVTPYFAQNISDFWKKWHISLSTWLKDYVYIWFLGGNKRSALRTYMNLLVTMLLGGLWHGANWNFVFWGLLHGLALIIHKLFSKNFLINSKLWSYFSWLLTFVFVCFAWIFFRAENLDTALYIIVSITQFSSSSYFDILLKIVIFYFFITILLDILELKFGDSEYLALSSWSILCAILLPVWIAIVLYLYTIVEPSPFIYFQF